MLFGAVMLGALVAISSVGVAQDAAKVAGPGEDAVGALTGDAAVVLSSSFDVHYEHGCSRSFESIGSQVTLTLEMTPSGTSRLTVTLGQTSTMGPSFGEFRAGARDFYSTRRREHHVFEGTGERSASGWKIRFRTVRSAALDLPEYGEAPMPPAQERDTELEMTCEPKRVPVFRPVAPGKIGPLTEGETPTPTRILLCRPSAELTSTYHLPLRLIQVDEALPLARDPGLSVYRQEADFGSQLVVRRAPPRR